MKLFSSKILKRIEDVVTISPNRLSIEATVITSPNESLKCKYLVFPLHIDSKSIFSISLKSINCMFTYNGLAIQSIVWKDGNGFATNGTKIEGVTIEPIKDGDVKCLFNPFPHIPLLPESNERWGIKGSIEFRCFYGSFKKEFEFNGLSVKLKEWEKFRSEYQNLYLSVFSKRIEVIT